MKMRTPNIKNYINLGEEVRKIWNCHNTACVCPACCALRLSISSYEKFDEEGPKDFFSDPNSYEKLKEILKLYKEYHKKRKWIRSILDNLP